MSPSEIRRLIEKGILAPSADNLQPWKFRLLKDSLELHIDAERISNFCDTGLLVPYLSAGAVIENIRVQAAHLGYRLHVRYFPDKANPLLAAEIFLDKDSAAVTPYWEALEKRSTNRKFYQCGKLIPLEAYDRLIKTIDEAQGFKLDVVRKNEPAYHELSTLIGNADQLRFESERLHRELMAIMRFNRTSVQQTRDGLDIETLEAGPGSGLTFRLMSSWGRMKMLNAFGMSRVFNWYARFQMQSSQAAMLLTSPTQTPTDYVKGGEFMERLWHEAALLGLALQPMEALPIFILNLQQNGGVDFSENQRKSLIQMKDHFFNIFKLDDQKGLILFFRLGYAQPAQAKSVRRPVESFILSEP